MANISNPLASGMIGGFRIGHAPPAVEPAPALRGLQEQLDTALTTIDQAYGRISSAADRLVGPLPQGVGETQRANSQQSLGARMESALAEAQDLGKRLHAVADRLDAAV